MTTDRISVGIVAPSPEAATRLVGLISATNLITITIVLHEYCAMEDDPATQRFIKARPDLIFIDMKDRKAALKALTCLYALLPGACIAACAGSADPSLIVETMQAGGREFLTEPLSADEIAVACRRYLDEKKRRHQQGGSRGKIYSIASAKGGDGCTSIAVNLAVTLSEMHGTGVAILDLNNPPGDAAAYLNLKPEFANGEGVRVISRLDSETPETPVSRARRVTLLLGSDFAGKLPGSVPGTLARSLRMISSTYTHTFVDMPSSPDVELLLAAAEVSDAVLIIATPDLPSIWRTRRLIVPLGGSHRLDRVRLILNRDGSRDELSWRDICEVLGHPIYWRLPNDYNTSIEAINKGKPVVQSNHSRLADSLRGLTHVLTGICPPKHRRSGLGFSFGPECLELKANI